MTPVSSGEHTPADVTPYNEQMPKHVFKASAHTPNHAAFVLDPELPVLSHGRDLEADARIAPHSHPRGQLLWAAEGVLRVTTEGAIWIVPASHAVWIPGGCVHQLMTETNARTRNLYIDPTFPVRQQAPGCSMLLLTPLMREIILRLTTADMTEASASFKRLGLVAIDEIDRLQASPHNLPAGQDTRLRRLISHLLRHPDESRPLPELGKIAGASVRTLERLFTAETGMSFRKWRSHLRLLNAIELLRQGKSSTTVAHSLGYRSPSAFVAAFRQHFGSPPQSFLSQIDQG